jgi:hypothetical protein
MGKTLIGSILGQQLSAVCFVRDYIELHFDGPFIQLLGPVTVLGGGITISDNMPGFKDEICEFIGITLGSLELEIPNQLTMVFENKGSVRVSARGVKYEFAILISSPDGDTQVWQTE